MDEFTHIATSSGWHQLSGSNLDISSIHTEGLGLHHFIMTRLAPFYNLRLSVPLWLCDNNTGQPRWLPSAFQAPNHVPHIPVDQGRSHSDLLLLCIPRHLHHILNPLLLFASINISLWRDLFLWHSLVTWFQ